MQVKLNVTTNSLEIKQTITYYNNSKDTLDCLYLHDWNNAFSNKKSDLGKRFIENYKKSFFFAKEKNRGITTINSVSINNKNVNWERPQDSFDYLKIPFKKHLLPKDSVNISLEYLVKIPNEKYTSYGFGKEFYNLRYWHLVPVVYDGNWQLMHHLNMDDLQQNPTNYRVSLIIPEGYFLASNLKISQESKTKYILKGNQRQDLQLHINTEKVFENFETDEITISTNLNKKDKIEKTIKNDLLNRQLIFLKQNLGSFPHKKILISKTTYNKNPLYGMNQLPSFLRPFSDAFEWDIRMFKIVSQEYINKSLLSNSRKNTWLKEGMHAYMMIKYVENYYPNTKLIGKLSKIWGIRSYHFSDLAFNERYNLAYQYTASSNHDQALSTSSDSLTNFNRLITQKYKAGIALNYLDKYLGKKIVPTALQKYFKDNTLKKGSKSFQQQIKSQTKKEVDWFFGDFLNTDKKIDYSIKKEKKTADSITLTIKNKRNISVPISLYSINKKNIQFKGWYTNIDTTKTITMSSKGTNKWILNYENIVPEINLRNNTESTNWKLFKKPLKIRLVKDAEHPTHTQLFIDPLFDYNFYDGIIFASTIKNASTLHRAIEYAITPSYSFRSKSLSGSAKMVYHKYIESEVVNSFRIGVVGRYFHYQPSLAYRKYTPYAQLFFKRKNPRSVKNSSVSINYTFVDKDIDLNNYHESEFYKYGVFKLGYYYANPELINNTSCFTELEIGKEFSKLSADIRFRKLTNNNQQFGIRLFTGLFMHNKTTHDFYSFGVNRPNDYLFKYAYMGRNETNGFFSQQIIINDGGFKSKIPVGYANKWITSLSTSISLWRWLELYNDVGFIKNTGNEVYFAHDKGLRLNFVNNIFEIYLPIHSNNGWEVSKPHYERSIRFLFKPYLSTIYNYFKRGFY